MARELGVRYVLEGSVQKSGNRVRINAQLIDAQSGDHQWAESYDRVLEDIFAIQDDITIKLMEALQVKLLPGGRYHHFGARTDKINAYMKFLQGLEFFFRMTDTDSFNARMCFAEAIAIDQNYSLSYAKTLIILRSYSKSLPKTSSAGSMDYVSFTLFCVF